MIKNLINNFFKDWVVFDGKVDRKSFFINILINLISQIAFTLLILNSFFGSNGIIKVILGFLALLIYGCLQINFYSLIVRRLHDNNKSAWWILLFFLSIVFSTGIRQSKSNEEQVIFSALLVFSASLFLYLLFSSDKKQKTLKRNGVKYISSIRKFYLFKNYKILVIAILIITIPILFVFVPYKTKYYQCQNYDQTRSLIINKYLPNSYSMVISTNKLRPHVIKKQFCRSNDDSIGFVCKFKIPINENMDELLAVRKRALSAGDTKSVQELDEYINSLSYKKYLYRFDPITTRLKEVIRSSEEGEISNEIYQCEKTDTNF